MELIEILGVHLSSGSLSSKVMFLFLLKVRIFLIFIYPVLGFSARSLRVGTGTAQGIGMLSRGGRDVG